MTLALPLKRISPEYRNKSFDEIHSEYSAEEIKDTISEDENFNQLMGNILIELLANQGLEELKNGI